MVCIYEVHGVYIFTYGMHVVYMVRVYMEYKVYLWYVCVYMGCMVYIVCVCVYGVRCLYLLCVHGVYVCVYMVCVCLDTFVYIWCA